MRNILSATAAIFSLAVISMNTAMADDPCAGHGVACDTGGCVVCWPNDNDGIDCEEASYEEVLVTLPGCAPPLPSNGTGDLAMPESLRLPILIGTGDRTVLPQSPVPQVRVPSTLGQ